MRVWEEFLVCQEKEIGKVTVDIWLRSLKVLCFDACNLYLEANDFFKINWFEEHIRPKVETSFFNNNNKKIRVHLSLFNAPSLEKKDKEETQEKEEAFLFELKDFDLKEEENGFESFVLSQENELAYKLLYDLSVNSDSINSIFNPIYIYGKEGSGKTHLISSCAKVLRKKGKKILYIKAESFIDHVVRAIRTGRMQEFRNLYRKVEGLFVDDIDVFSGKNATQEEFFHTFNELHLERKLLILTSSYSPQDLHAMEERLVSRFEWGVVVPMKPLDKENTERVFKQSLERYKISFSKEVLSYFLEVFDYKIKTLIEVLKILVFRSKKKDKFLNEEFSIEDLQFLMGDFFEKEKKKKLTPSKIVCAVAEYYGIKVEDILGRSQSRECVLPRQIVMYICRDHLHLPFIKIGNIFSRDHSTVIASIKQIQQGLNQRNKELLIAFKNILLQLNL